LTSAAPPVELRPGRSRLYAALLSAVTLAAVVAVAISGVPLALKFALAALAVLLAGRAWRRQAATAGITVRLSADGGAEWVSPDAGPTTRGRLVAHWQAGPVATLVLAAAPAGRPRWRVAIFRDQVDAEAWRRLAILLRHRRRGDDAIP
jgi:hypothetical protein